ncbi:AI-2E family transporter [Amorphoplanes digitatis]|uniref:Putative PurR-regulated permease PerM n=1 Tax=Actinoplanes digitatis TaxID=1868 RepID=A0A7W7I058_9ACTN|nr:AI-2E family transporter [Actinoplanes digitatis]MBB4763975.1 putative PurR-regulated permease PerM [Actinoplanes digitatis]GID93794.1 AI-2E family transporter [Actinoplanes digitatis]
MTGAPAEPPAAEPPAALPRGVIVLLGIAGVVIAVAGLRGVAHLIAPVFLALMLTVTVSPLSEWLRRHGSPVWVAMLATVTVVYVVLFGLGAAMVVSVAQLIDLLPTYQTQFADLQADIVSALSRLGISESQLTSVLERASPSAVTDLVGWVFGGITSVLSDAVFLLAVLLFMCLDAVSFPARLNSTADQRPQVVSALRSFAHGTRSYLLVSTVFGLIVAVIDTLMLWALDIPLPVLWGLLAFITNYIPNIGFVIGLVPPALLGLLDGGVEKMMAVIVLYCVVNFVIQSVIQPKIVGDAVGLSSTVSFLSLVFWAWVLGPLGALLAIPLSLLTKGLLVDVDPSTQWINVLLSGGGSAPPPVPEPEPDPVPETEPRDTAPGE